MEDYTGSYKSLHMVSQSMFSKHGIWICVTMFGFLDYYKYSHNQWLMDFWEKYENYFYFLPQSNGPIIDEIFTTHFHIGWLFRLVIEHTNNI